MKKAFSLMLLLGSLVFCMAQTGDVPFRLHKIIKGDIVDFTLDNLGNIYTLSRNNQLKKLNANGDSVGVFNNVRQYGKIYSVDATNPLKVLLYYKDFGNIVVLDRFLNVRNTINLRRVNIFQVKAICQSYDNGIWIYDEQDARLKKLNDEGIIVSQSSDFRLFMDKVPSPVQLIDQDRLVYLYDPDQGLFIFDYFGTMKNKVALTGWQDVQVVGGKIIGRDQSVVKQYEPGLLSLKEQTLTRILAGVIKMKITRTNLFCLKEDVIEVYAF